MRGNQYTTQEVKAILADKSSGMSYSHLKLKYGRAVGGIRSLVYNYSRFQHNDKKYISKRMLDIYEIVASGNNHDHPKNVIVAVEHEKTDSLAKLESAFRIFQEVMVEVIEEEVKNRSGDWVKRAVTAEAELTKYKEVAQQSSMIGTLRRRWGLGVPGPISTN
jgi:hypothetical protein